MQIVTFSLVCYVVKCAAPIRTRAAVPIVRFVLFAHSDKDSCMSLFNNDTYICCFSDSEDEEKKGSDVLPARTPVKRKRPKSHGK